MIVMKHHCHCGLEKHLHRFHAKKFGIFGVTLMALHILFHVVECLILPSLFVAFSGHLHEEDALAASPEAIVTEADNTTSTACSGLSINGDFVLDSTIFAYPRWTRDTIPGLFESLYCE